jgi:hypothetical protein
LRPQYVAASLGAGGARKRSERISQLLKPARIGTFRLLAAIEHLDQCCGST